MSKAWQDLTGRVNKMSGRERFLLFVAVVGVFAALTYLLFIAPLTRAQRQRAQQIEQQSATLEGQKARLEKEIAQGRRERLAAVQDEVARVQSEIEGVEREIAALSGAEADPGQLRATLTRVLGRGERVALLRVSTAESAAASPPGVTIATPHGLDITLTGGYLDLMDSLSALEAAMPQARWSSLRFTAETIPPQASVRIITPRVENPPPRSR